MQKRFNHYYLTEQIDSKPLRSAYLAHPVNDASQKVLLKIFDATCLAFGQESERLLHQMEWIKQLRHEHMVPILDLGVEQGQPYVVSEYLSGGSLRRRLDSLSPGRLSLEEAFKIILQVGQALSYFHLSARLHQNIKPENIFFNGRDEVLLADFRLSGFIDVATIDYQSDPRNMCYMAPEQFVGTASEKSDQYSLACLAYELIAGQVPFSAQSFAMMWASHYAQFPAPLSDLVPDLPKWIGKAVFKAMSKDPSERYADIAAFLLALEGPGESTVLAITRPVDLSARELFSASIAKSLENIKSDAPVTTSLAGIPSEGSLANAPFGMSLAGGAFGMSLPGVPFGMSLPGVPFGTSLPGVPFGMSLPGNPLSASLSGMTLATSQKSEILEKEEAGNPFEMSPARKLFEMSPVENPSEMSSEENPSEMSPARKLFETSPEENPSEMSPARKLFETSQAGKPSEIIQALNAFETNVALNTFEMRQEEDFFGKILGEAGLLDTPLTNHLLERWERASNEPPSSTNLDSSIGHHRSDSLSRGQLWRNTKYSIPAFWSGPRKSSVATNWLIRLRGYLKSALGTVQTNSRRRLALLSKQLVHLLKRRKHISGEDYAKFVKNAYGASGEPSIKPFSVGRFFQYRRDSNPLVRFVKSHKLPTFIPWFVLVLSIIVLIGFLTSYLFGNLQSSEPFKSVNLGKKYQTVVNVKNGPINTQLIEQPVAHATGVSDRATLSGKKNSL